MGLIKKDYTINGVVLPNAYAMIGKVKINKDDTAWTEFHIHTSRENDVNELPLQKVGFFCGIDRNQSVYEQIYIKAKEDIFKEWQDDIQEDI